MRVRMIAAVAVAAALAVPALAQGQPNRHRLDVTVAPGQFVALTFGTVPQGEFKFRVRASSDGEKRFTLTQKRDNGTRFTVLKVPSATANGACQGAAGTLVCSGITTPATPAGHAWNFRLRNRSNRPISFTLTIAWRAVPSAG